MPASGNRSFLTVRWRLNARPLAISASILWFALTAEALWILLLVLFDSTLRASATALAIFIVFSAIFPSLGLLLWLRPSSRTALIVSAVAGLALALVGALQLTGTSGVGFWTQLAAVVLAGGAAMASALAHSALPTIGKPWLSVMVGLVLIAAVALPVLRSTLREAPPPPPPPPIGGEAAYDLCKPGNPSSLPALVAQLDALSQTDDTVRLTIRLEILSRMLPRLELDPTSESARLRDASIAAAHEARGYADDPIRGLEVARASARTLRALESDICRH